MGKTYQVVYTRNPDGWWTVQIPGNPGGVNCVSQGKSIKQARERVREALWACLDDKRAADEAVFEEEIVAPGSLRSRIKKLRAAREKLALLEKESASETRDAVRALSDEGLTIRDAAEVLGISFQRVHQLLEKESDTAEKATQRRAGPAAVRRSKNAGARQREKKRA